MNKWLNGNLDCLLKGEHDLLVIEAKNDDLTRVFTQLATKLIAISEVEEKQFQYGAFTTGDVWRFGRLDGNRKQIIEDITIYSLPDNLEA